MTLLRNVARHARCGICIKHAVRLALLTNEIEKLQRGMKWMT